jgi:hypothetical protein
VAAAWSNDGTRLLLIRGYTGHWEDSRAAVIPVDRTSGGVDIPYEASIQGGCLLRLGVGAR